MASLAEKRVVEAEADAMPPEHAEKVAQGPVGLKQVNRDDSDEPDVQDDDAVTIDAALDESEFSEAELAAAAKAELAEAMAEAAEAETALAVDEAVVDPADEAALEDSESAEAIIVEAEAVEEAEAEIVAAAEVAEIEVATAEVAPVVVGKVRKARKPAKVASAVEVEAAVAVAKPASPDSDETELHETRPEELRLLEALLFAAIEPLDTAELAKRMPGGVDIKAALAQLQDDYALRGVNLVRVAGKWTFRTAYDLAWLMTRESKETRKLSRAAVEMLAIVAYHQPVTRAEIEDIRGVVTSKGTLDVLLETGWIRPRGRRKTPGRPLTFGTTDTFLSQFNLETLGDLPGLEELKGTGLLDSRLPGGFSVPNPSDDPALRDDEDPLEIEDLQLTLASAVEPEDEPALDTGQSDAAGASED